MRSSSPSRIATVLAAIAVLLLGTVAIGCGGDDGEPTPPTTEGEEQAEEAPEAEEPTATGAERGEQVFAEQACSNCHSIGEGAGPGHGSGPPLGGLFNSRVELRDGTTVRANENYLARAINDPDAEIVQGFSEGAMAAAIPPGSIPEEDVEALVEYLKTLGE